MGCNTSTTHLGNIETYKSDAALPNDSLVYIVGLMHLTIFLGEYPFYNPSLVKDTKKRVDTL